MSGFSSVDDAKKARASVVARSGGSAAVKMNGAGARKIWRGGWCVDEEVGKSVVVEITGRDDRGLRPAGPGLNYLWRCPVAFGLVDRATQARFAGRGAGARMLEPDQIVAAVTIEAGS